MPHVEDCVINNHWIHPLCNMRVSEKEDYVVIWRVGVAVSVVTCVCVDACVYSLTGRQPCWLSSSPHWLSSWVGGTLCCPSRGSATSGRRWCLLDWPPDNTDARWTVWQVGQITSHSLCHFILLSFLPTP